MPANYDFSGWATRNDLLCSDGRTIRRDAFKNCDGKVVPLVFSHQHTDVRDVLGKALLQNKPEGVYMYGKFNDTESGQTAKELVRHGDVTSLSIYANQLKQDGGNVLHGAIREVSLVLAGANPGAYIDSVIKHGIESDDEAIIYMDDSDTQLELFHSDLEIQNGEHEEEDSIEPKETDTLSHASDDDQADENGEGAKDMASEKTVKDVFDTLNEEQKTVVYALIGQALEDAGVNTDEEDEDVKHNVFDADETMEEGTYLTHEDEEAIFANARRCGSLRESVLQHGDATYGIENIDFLFPEAKAMTDTPEFIKRDTDWVQKVMGAVHHTPFSRIKSVFANITEDEARAKGYIKGNQKKEEVFPLLKRTTDPTTIYKKQKLDRDDMIDITSFNVVAWLKSEMRIMLDEEIARAILIGDGRLPGTEDKINETNIRPVVNDDPLYSIQSKVTVAAEATPEDVAKEFIRTVIKARKQYKGSGSPTLFTTEDMLTECLLLEDKVGHALYADETQLAHKMRVKEIVTVPPMEGMKGKDKGDLLGIVVNLADYNVGADKGGSINMFDDFDIDYNQQKYLMETRCSGALTKPYSAMVFERADAV